MTDADMSDWRAAVEASQQPVTPFSGYVETFGRPSPSAALEERAREVLASAYERAGYRDEAAAFRAGSWTCHDHPAIRAMLAFARDTPHPASAREERLAAALEPFAKMGALLEGPFAPALFRDDQAIGMGGAWSENGVPRTITYGDLRRARAALAEPLP